MYLHKYKYLKHEMQSWPQADTAQGKNGYCVPDFLLSSQTITLFSPLQTGSKNGGT